MAEHAWAAAEVCALVLLELWSDEAWGNQDGEREGMGKRGNDKAEQGTHHLCEASCCYDPSGVNEPVEETSLKVEVPAKVILDLLVWNVQYKRTRLQNQGQATHRGCP